MTRARTAERRTDGPSDATVDVHGRARDTETGERQLTIGLILRRERDAIVERWHDAVRTSPSASPLSREDVIDTLPAYLESLAATRDDSTRAERDAIIDAHVGQRLRLGCTVHDVVCEYSTLGRIIAETWASAAPEPTAGDVSFLFQELDRAISKTVENFNAHLTTEAQAEKRFLTLLQNVATLALSEGPLRNRLPELLRVVLDALEAPAGGIVLQDAASGRVTSSVATGVPEHDQPAYATELMSSPLAREAATSPRAVSIEQPGYVFPKSEDDLRRRGVQAVLAMRLRVAGRSVGLVFTALPAGHHFKMSDERRLEALAERLALLLDNARVYDAWRENFEALQRERALREEFNSTLVHDLRGPLSGARMQADLIVRDAANESARQVARAAAIIRALDRLDRMIRDLLDAKRIAFGGTLSLRLDTVDLGKLCAAALEELAVLQGDRLRLEAQEGVLGSWDRDELHRALWNLVTNAIRYGDAATPVITRVYAHAGSAYMLVHNEGPPIPPEDVPNLFKPFSRARNATGTGESGWGLGLTLVRACAEAHGGDVKVESAPGKGTTFIVRLPLCR